MKGWGVIWALLVIGVPLCSSVTDEANPVYFKGCGYVQKWSQQRAADLSAPLQVVDSRIYFYRANSSYGKSSVEVLDASSGAFIWEGTTLTPPGGPLIMPTVFSAGDVHTTIAMSGPSQQTSVVAFSDADHSTAPSIPWSYLIQTDQTVSQSAVSAEEGWVYVADGEKVMCLDADTSKIKGALLWSYAISGAMSPAVLDGLIIVPSSTGLFALSAVGAETEMTVTMKWHLPVYSFYYIESGRKSSPPPVVYEGRIYLAAQSGAEDSETVGEQILCINPDGTIEWRVLLADLLPDVREVRALPVVVSEGHVVFTTYSPIDAKSYLVRLDRLTGDTSWMKSSSTRYGVPTIADQQVFVPTFEATKIKIDIYTEEDGNYRCQPQVDTGAMQTAPPLAVPWVVAHNQYVSVVAQTEGGGLRLVTASSDGSLLITSAPDTAAPILKTKSPRSDSQEEGFGVTELALLVVGCVGCVLLTACIFAMLIREKRRVPRNRKNPGASKSKYKVMKELGRGAFGVVYLVQRKADGELLAMKYLQCKDDHAQEEALTEFKFLRQFQGHPNMVGVVETFMSWTSSPTGKGDGLIDSNRYVCLVMPYYKRGDLKQFVVSYPDDCLPEEMLLRMTEQLCSLLHYLHFRQPPLIHRDLKPENVLISDDGRPIVADFGLAKNLETMYCATRAGTAAFLAPECWGKHYGIEVFQFLIKGYISPFEILKVYIFTPLNQVDIWAVGCILYASATRRVRSDNIRVMFSDCAKPGFTQDIMSDLVCTTTSHISHIPHPPPHPPQSGRGYSKVFCDLVMSMLEFDYHKRPKAYDIVSSLRRRREGGGTTTSDTSNTDALPVPILTPSPPPQLPSGNCAGSPQCRKPMFDSQATVYTSTDLQRPLLGADQQPGSDSLSSSAEVEGNTVSSTQHMLIVPPRAGNQTIDSPYQNCNMNVLSKDSQATCYITSSGATERPRQLLHNPLQHHVAHACSNPPPSNQCSHEEMTVVDSQATVLLSSEMPSSVQLQSERCEQLTGAHIDYNVSPVPVEAHALITPNGIGAPAVPDDTTIGSQATVLISEESSFNQVHDTLVQMQPFPPAQCMPLIYDTVREGVALVISDNEKAAKEAQRSGLDDTASDEVIGLIRAGSGLTVERTDSTRTSSSCGADSR